MNEKTKESRPEYPMDKQVTLWSLFEEESLDEILWQVANATDLAVALADFKGDECTDCINYAEFCRYMREGESPLCSVSNATNAFGITQAAVQKKPFIYFCPYGLLMFAIPIIVEGEFIGGLVGGQVRCEDAPPDTVQLNKVMPFKEDFLEDDVIREKYMEAHLIPYKKYLSMAYLMESYFQQLTEKRSKNRTKIQLLSREKELDAERIRRMQAEKRSSKYRLSSMRTQMNPYFVMTTLIAISNMAIIENAVMTNELINRFAGFMSSLFQKNEEIITLQEEADIIDSYLGIYKFWLDKKLSYTINIGADVHMQYIPAMLVFTLVEQSVCHTISMPDYYTEIIVHAQPEGDYCVIRIWDNRPADQPGDENRKWIMEQIESMQGNQAKAGIELVRERMAEYFQGNAKLTIEEEDGNMYCLKIPRAFEKE